MNATRYIATITNDATCLPPGGNITLEISEADLHFGWEGTDQYGNDIESVEPTASSRVVLTVDTGIAPADEEETIRKMSDWDDFLPAGWTRNGEWEVQTSAYTVEVTPDDPQTVPSPELPASRVKAILGELNAHAQACAEHDDDCGCNPFGDVIYGIPELSGPLTEARFRDDEYAFVLVDGTEVEQRSNEWTAARYHHTPESIESGDYGHRIAPWQMDASGTLLEHCGDTWRTTRVPSAVTLYETNSGLLVAAKDGQAWSLGVPHGDYLNGDFAADAEAWADGDWEPSDSDGQTPTSVDDLTPVAEWGDQGVRLLVEADKLGAAARIYLYGRR